MSVCVRAAEALEEAVDAVAREDIDAWAPGALADDLCDMRRQINRLEAEFIRRLRVFDERKGWRDEGAPSPAAWLRDRCGLAGGAASQRVEVARQLDKLPSVDEEFRRGDVGYHHAAVLARLVTEVGPEAARMAEDTLLEAARRLDPTRLRVVARRLRHCVDPDGALAQAIRDHDRRFLHLSETFDGVFVLDGLLDAEGGAALQTALGSLSAPMPGDSRSAAERRADGLVELALRQLAAGDLPATGGQRPHLVLTASAGALSGQAHPDVPDMAFAGPVTAETARRIACDASISEVVVADDGEPLSSGRARRTVPAAMRRALLVRDRGCRYPGCDRPPAWTDAHHIRHWADGGETRISNLVLLCRVHHRRVHEDGWKLEATPGGALVAQPP